MKGRPIRIEGPAELDALALRYQRSGLAASESGVTFQRFIEDPERFESVGQNRRRCWSRSSTLHQAQTGIDTPIFIN